MIVVIEETGSMGSSQIRRALTDWGAPEVLDCRIGGCIVLLVDHAKPELADRVRQLSASVKVIFPLTGSPLAERANFTADTVVQVGSAAIGADRFTVIAGPCAVETRDQMLASATAVRDGGGSVLRGGAYKPRTSPYSFQGTGRDGIALLAEIGHGTGLPVVSEVIDPRDVAHMAEHVDMLQVGTRNAQNYALLTEVGRAGVPVLLKRGFGCTVEEWLCAAEYILCRGNSNVVLCERGIRTFEPGTRFTLDLAAVSVVKQRSHLPVVVDPSHGTGSRELVEPLALAAAAAGADGLIIDVHPDSGNAMCDADQALSSAAFAQLTNRLGSMLNGLGRPLAQPAVATAAK